MLDGEEPSGAPEAGLDLVGGEEDAVLLGDLAEARQERPRRHDVAALPDDRLHDDEGHLVGLDDLVEEQVQALLPVAGAGVGAVRATRGPVAVGEVGLVGGARQGLERGAVGGLRRGERHRLRGAPVEAVAEADDGAPPRGRTGELDRGLHGLRAGVGQEGLPRTAGQQLREAFVEEQAGLVVDDVLLAVEELGGLPCDGRCHARVSVAGVGDTDAGGVVEVALRHPG